ncbi:MAG: hypothetical protein ABR510_00335 [Trueperaceae bacterium]
MKLRSWIAIVLVVPVLAVAAFNVPALLDPVPVDLLVATVRMPLWPFVVGVPLVLAAVFLGAALLDRSRQLRQVAALERQLEEARAVVERGREQALDGAVRELTGRFDALESVVEGVGSGMESRLAARLDALGARRDAGDEAVRERLSALHERVVRVRDELAADVAKTEDAVLRALEEADRTVDVDDGREQPRLPGGDASDLG